MSVDWLELVFELYGPVEDWPENLKIRIAHSLGYCTRNPGENEKKEALKKLRGKEEEEARKEEERNQEYERDEKRRRSSTREGGPGRTFSGNLLPENGISTGRL